MSDSPGTVLPRPSVVALCGRAAVLRCPWCGGGGLLASWFRFRPRCRRCGLRTERGEEDFFLGAMVFNIALSEGILAVAFVGLLVALWPDVPWRALQVGGMATMVAAPFLFYPVSRTLWMVVELLVRPLTVEELAWHRDAAEGEFRPQEAR